jgi:hypothetical protein
VKASGQDSKGLFAGRRGIEVATIVVIVGAMLMIVSEFLDVFTVEGVNGATVGSSTGAENHGYALLVIGVAALAAVFFARSTREPLPAFAAAALGVIALGIVLIVDLPDTMSSGLTESHRIGDAQPAIGFWVELVAALMVAGGGAAIALATRDPTQNVSDDYQR